MGRERLTESKQVLITIIPSRKDDAFADSIAETYFTIFRRNQEKTKPESIFQIKSIAFFVIKKEIIIFATANYVIQGFNLLIIIRCYKQ